MKKHTKGFALSLSVLQTLLYLKAVFEIVMRKLTTIFCALFWGFSCVKAEIVSPSSYWVLEDTSGTLSIETIKGRNDFKQVKTLNFGYTSSAFWIKIPIENHFENNSYCVVARHPSVWELDFYLFKNDSLVKEKLVGLSRPMRNRELLLDRYFLEVTPNDSSTQTVFVKLKEAGASVHNNIYFQLKFDMQRSSSTSAILYYASSGVVLLLTIYTALNYFRQRKKLFLYYGLTTLSLIAYQWIQIEFAFHYLPESWVVFTHQLRFFLLIPILIFWLLFTYHVLAIDTMGSSLVKRTYAVLIRIFPLFLSLFILNILEIEFNKYVAILLFYTLMVFSFGFVLYNAIISARNGHRPARYFLLGQAPLILVYIFFLFRNFGLISSSETSLFLPLFCLLFEILVMFVCMERHFRFEQTITQAVAKKLPKQTVLESITQKTIEETGKEKIGKDILELYDRILAFFEEEKIYLNPELKLSDVAEKLNVPSYKISECINSCSDMHFFDFTNSYRVETAKLLIKDKELKQRYTIEYIVSQSGFSSKSTFNAAFKKFTGLTPTQFRAAA